MQLMDSKIAESLISHQIKYNNFMLYLSPGAQIIWNNSWEMIKC